MSVSISQRPAAFSPVNNPVVYKFAVTGGPFTLYRLVINVHHSVTNDLIGSMSKSPDPSGNILADVSSIIKTILARDWVLAIQNEEFTGGCVGFYIKYQEFYTGSATSPIDDVAEPRTAVLASLQVRNNADMTDYVPANTLKKFLTKFDKPSMWRGYPFSISFIRPSSLSGLVFYYNEIDQYGNVIGSKAVDVSGSEDSVFRGFISNLNTNTKKILATLSDGGIEFTEKPEDWTDGANAFGLKTTDEFIKDNATGGTTYSAYQAVNIPSGSTPNNIFAGLNWQKNNPGSGTTIDFYIKFYDTLGGTVVGSSHIGPFVTENYDQDQIFTFSPLTDVATIMEISFVVFGGSLDDVSIVLQSGQVVYTDSGDAVSETKEITVKDPCENPVYLFWKNTLGGDAFWLFDGSQDFGFSYDNEKAKRLTLFVEDISINEWEALNELNTIGSLFKTNIEELTTSVNKTKERSDQQIYDIDTAGNKIGVVNITNELMTKTDQVKHMFMTTIEYPEIFLG
jgi:hypothetical protein